mmetsp:Transcript_23660/g.67933  ORF Transcript_23660/g.67933 Transcript_23660/m.67933 type:complete len:253 (+) Transcript_23660:3389-4147(+)
MPEASTRPSKLANCGMGGVPSAGGSRPSRSQMASCGVGTEQKRSLGVCVREPSGSESEGARGNSKLAQGREHRASSERPRNDSELGRRRNIPGCGCSSIACGGRGGQEGRGAATPAELASSGIAPARGGDGGGKLVSKLESAADGGAMAAGASANGGKVCGILRVQALGSCECGDGAGAAIVAVLEDGAAAAAVASTTSAEGAELTFVLASEGGEGGDSVDSGGPAANAAALRSAESCGSWWSPYSQERKAL